MSPHTSQQQHCPVHPPRPYPRLWRRRRAAWRLRFSATAAGLTLVVLAAGLIVGVAGNRVVIHPHNAGPAIASTPTSTPNSPGVAGQMATLTAQLPPGSLSVAARNLKTGATFRYGSTGDQTAASIAKVDILETLMLQVQGSGEPLSVEESYDATVMIEDSDDDAGTDLYQDVGGASGVTAANLRLGLRCTVPGADGYWGLTTTCAADQLRLLYQLESTSSPLTQTSRVYILNLLQNVAASQQWGVPAVADTGTLVAVKDGWLNMQGDSDWAVNSVGIVTYKGQTLLIATLSQNNNTMASGVSLDQQVAKLAAESVTAT